MRVSRKPSALFVSLSFAPAVCFVCLQGTQGAYASTISLFDSNNYGSPAAAEQAFVAAVGSNPLGQQNFGSYSAGTYPAGVSPLYSLGAESSGYGYAPLSVVTGGPVGGGTDVSESNTGIAVLLGGSYYYGYSYAYTANNPLGYPLSVNISTGTSLGTITAASSGFFGVVSSTPLSLNESALSISANGPSGTTYLDDVLYADGPGISTSNPLYPDSTCDPGWTASMCSVGPRSSGSNGSGGGGGGCSIDGVQCYVWGLGGLGLAWLDPAAADEYVYQTLDGSLFTSIEGFPTGFSAPFDVSSGGIDYGLFEPGQTLTFLSGGVSSFTISGIDPAVDGTSPTAFPLEVSMNQIGAEVEATAYDESSSTPEPSSYLLCAAGLMFVGNHLRSRGRTRTN